MIQQIQILSLWVDGNNWVVETEPGTYRYVPRANPDNGLNDDAQLYFLSSYIERVQNDAVGKTIVIDPTSDNMVRVEPIP
jgi:hypothetical protein